MNVIGKNIQFLRKQKGMTQEAFAKEFGLTRAVIGSYEEGRAVPRLNVLQEFAKVYKLSIDKLVNVNLSKENGLDTPDLKILTTVVNSDNREQIVVVPVQASAGYTTGYSDPEYIENLPVFQLPLPELSSEKTYRLFQIRGSSMEPVKPGSYIICEYIPDTNDLGEGKAYILLTKDDGIVYKRLYLQKSRKVMLKSDNPDFEPYEIEVDQILEIWKALGFISFQLPDNEDISMSRLHNMVMDLKTELDDLKKKNKT